MSATVEIPVYLQDNYVIKEREHFECLDSLLAWYWTNWQFMRENLYDTTEEKFLSDIQKCVTMSDMKKLVNKYI